MMWRKVAWVSQESLMHFNEDPGKPKLREMWEGSGVSSPVL